MEVFDVEAGEVADHEIAGAFVGSEVGDVVLALCAGGIEVFAPALLLREHRAFPENVDELGGAARHADGVLEAGELAAVGAVGLKESVPEGLGVGVLVGGVFPCVGEFRAAGADFVHGEGHGGRVGLPVMLGADVHLANAAEGL